MAIRNLSTTLQLAAIGNVCLTTISTQARGPILPSGSITVYLLAALHKTEKEKSRAIIN